MSSDLLGLDNSDDLGVVTSVAESDSLVTKARGVVEVGGTGAAHDTAALSAVVLPFKLGELPLALLTVLYQIVRNPV